MNLAIVGCGYVAEFYCKTLGNYPELKLMGAYDRDHKNLRSFCDLWSVRSYDSLEVLLAEPSVEMVLNLTNPSSHYEITKRCLDAGKHVYSEKPLAMDASRARELVELASQKCLYLAAAPCSVLGETAQTVWKALRENAIGRVRLVYANFDDGMIAPKLSPWQWKNTAGVAWPAKDEFEVGCTYEHAGYILTWFAAFFGPALKVSAFASCLIPEKGIAVDRMTPDFTVGCIEYADAMVARVTCSLVAPRDKSLTIIGEDGVLLVEDVRNDMCPVYVRRIPSSRLHGAIERRMNRFRAALRLPGSDKEWYVWTKLPMIGNPSGRFVSSGKQVDFGRGPVEMARAIKQKRKCRLSPELGWHITELIERLQYPERFVGRPKVESTFAAIEPVATPY